MDPEGKFRKHVSVDRGLGVFSSLAVLWEAGLEQLAGESQNPKPDATKTPDPALTRESSVPGAGGAACRCSRGRCCVFGSILTHG